MFVATPKKVSSSSISQLAVQPSPAVVLPSSQDSTGSSTPSVSLIFWWVFTVPSGLRNRTQTAPRFVTPVVVEVGADREVVDAVALEVAECR